MTKQTKLRRPGIVTRLPALVGESGAIAHVFL
jgi:hypothetical protein